MLLSGNSVASELIDTSLSTVWARFDQPQSLGRHKLSRIVALAIWMEFMGAILKGTPQHVLVEPEGITRIRIDSTNDKFAPLDSAVAYTELFLIVKMSPRLPLG